MDKIIKTVIKIIDEELKKDIKTIKNASTFEWENKCAIAKDKDNKWLARFDKITLTEKQKTLTLEEKKKILINKLTKKAEKEQEYYIKYFKEIEQSEDIKEIEIETTFVKSRTWGWCPFAEMWTDVGYIKTSRASGCGYDKESTTTAEALNTLKGIKKLIFKKLNKKSAKEIYNILKGADARDLLGYGLNFYKKVYFAGGVGVDCHLNILQNLGYKLIAEHHGQTSNYYKLKK